MPSFSITRFKAGTTSEKRLLINEGGQTPKIDPQVVGVEYFELANWDIAISIPHAEGNYFRYLI